MNVICDKHLIFNNNNSECWAHIIVHPMYMKPQLVFRFGPTGHYSCQLKKTYLHTATTI